MRLWFVRADTPSATTQPPPETKMADDTQNAQTTETTTGTPTAPDGILSQIEHDFSRAASTVVSEVRSIARPTAAQAVRMSQTGEAGGPPPVLQQLADLRRTLGSILEGTAELADAIGGAGGAPRELSGKDAPTSVAAQVDEALQLAGLVVQHLARAHVAVGSSD